MGGAHLFEGAGKKKCFLTSFSANELELFKSVCLVPRRMRKIRLVIPTGQNSFLAIPTKKCSSCLNVPKLKSEIEITGSIGSRTRHHVTGWG